MRKGSWGRLTARKISSSLVWVSSEFELAIRFGEAQCPDCWTTISALACSGLDEQKTYTLLRWTRTQARTFDCCCDIGSSTPRSVFEYSENPATLTVISDAILFANEIMCEIDRLWPASN